MAAQLPLTMRWPRRQRFEHFHAGENGIVVKTLASLPGEKRETGSTKIYLSGPKGSGKTHLLMAACQAAVEAGYAVQYLRLAGQPQPARIMRAVTGSQMIALDDLSGMAGDRDTELAMFELYNRVHAEHGVLLVADRLTPPQIELNLPDLRSRLSASTQFHLRTLSDEQRREVLFKESIARGISLDAPVLDWLFKRYKRDLTCLLDLLDRFDAASLAAQRRVTIPFLRELLKDDDLASIQPSPDDV